MYVDKLTYALRDDLFQITVEKFPAITKKDRDSLALKWRSAALAAVCSPWPGRTRGASLLQNA
jgi:hypothetical protein